MVLFYIANSTIIPLFIIINIKIHIIILIIFVF